MKNGIYCPGFGDETNGMSVVATCMLSDPDWRDVPVVHGAWLAGTWLACLRFGAYVRMPHGAYDPVRLNYHGWRKCLVGPVERFFLRRAKKVLATCAAEAEWIEAYEPRASVEVIDIGKYFFPARGRGGAEAVPGPRGRDAALHLLYLGRRHPLKGVAYLEQAVDAVNASLRDMRALKLRVVSDAVGTEKEKAWAWCDVLVLPTLSENFGLVIAEALAHGKRVLTTDGAPAWADHPAVAAGRLVYLRGFRDGSATDRVRLIAQGLLRCLRL